MCMCVCVCVCVCVDAFIVTESWLRAHTRRSYGLVYGSWTGDEIHLEHVLPFSASWRDDVDTERIISPWKTDRRR